MLVEAAMVKAARKKTTLVVIKKRMMRNASFGDGIAV